MTEYEIADLAASNTALMQTQGLMVQGYGNLVDRVSAWFVFTGLIRSVDDMEKITNVSLPRGIWTERYLLMITAFVILSILASR